MLDKVFEEIRDDKLRIGLLGLKRLFEANAKKMTKDEIMAFDFTFMNITNALTELQAIKEAKPSEALECWNWLNATIPQWCREKDKEHQDTLAPIKQSLLKAQEQEKENAEYKETLRIIFKYFDIKVVTSNESAFGCITIQRKGCNQMLRQAQKTTFKKEEQEEFNLLKRWCEKCQK